jgi:hypothetical protein
MSLHRFAVGQSVEFAPGRLDATATRGAYTVVRLHPDEPNDREYRVKNAQDGHERVVRESRIRLVRPAQGSAGRPRRSAEGGSRAGCGLVLRCAEARSSAGIGRPDRIRARGSAKATRAASNMPERDGRS